MEAPTKKEVIDQTVKDGLIAHHAPMLYVLAQAALAYLLLEQHLDKDQLIKELKETLNKIDTGWPS